MYSRRLGLSSEYQNNQYNKDSAPNKFLHEWFRCNYCICFKKPKACHIYTDLYIPEIYPLVIMLPFHIKFTSIWTCPHSVLPSYLLLLLLFIFVQTSPHFFHFVLHVTKYEFVWKIIVTILALHWFISPIWELLLNK